MWVHVYTSVQICTVCLRKKERGWEVDIFMGGYRGWEKKGMKRQRCSYTRRGSKIEFRLDSIPQRRTERERASTREKVKTWSDLQTSLTIFTSPRLQINTRAAAPEGATLLPAASSPPLPSSTKWTSHIIMRESIAFKLFHKEGRVSPKDTLRWRFTRSVMVILWRFD